MNNSHNIADTMLYIISYDSPDDRRRARIHNTLIGFGSWVQYSVFECFLNRKQRIKLEARLHKEINHTDDTIRIYGLCKACHPKVEVLGQGDRPKENHVYLL